MKFTSDYEHLSKLDNLIAGQMQNWVAVQEIEVPWFDAFKGEMADFGQYTYADREDEHLVYAGTVVRPGKRFRIVKAERLV